MAQYLEKYLDRHLVHHIIRFIFEHLSFAISLIVYPGEERIYPVSLFLYICTNDSLPFTVTSFLLFKICNEFFFFFTLRNNIRQYAICLYVRTCPCLHH